MFINENQLQIDARICVMKWKYDGILMRAKLRAY